MTPADQAVLDRVLRDLLSPESGDSPVVRDGAPPDELAISARSASWPIGLGDVLHQNAPEAWERLPAAAVPGLQVAAADLVARAPIGFDGFRSTDERIVSVGTAEEARRRLVGRPIHAWPPGYSTDGTLAVACLSIPWSIHHARATYVLGKQGAGWAVLVRQFVYYL